MQQAINSTTRYIASNGDLFRCIPELLTDHFRCSKVLNVPCACNSCTHETAKIDMRVGTHVDPLFGAILSHGL